MPTRTVTPPTPGPPWSTPPHEPRSRAGSGGVLRPPAGGGRRSRRCVRPWPLQLSLEDYNSRGSPCRPATSRHLASTPARSATIQGSPGKTSSKMAQPHLATAARRKNLATIFRARSHCEQKMARARSEGTCHPDPLRHSWTTLSQGEPTTTQDGAISRLLSHISTRPGYISRQSTIDVARGGPILRHFASRLSQDRAASRRFFTISRQSTVRGRLRARRGWHRKGVSRQCILVSRRCKLRSRHCKVATGSCKLISRQSGFARVSVSRGRGIFGR